MAAVVAIRPTYGTGGSGQYGLRAGYRFSLGPVVLGVGAEVATHQGGGGGEPDLSATTLSAIGYTGGNNTVASLAAHLGLPVGERSLVYASLGASKRRGSGMVDYALAASGHGGGQTHTTAGIGYEIVVGGGLSYFSEFLVTRTGQGGGGHPEGELVLNAPSGQGTKAAIRFGLNFSLP